MKGIVAEKITSGQNPRVKFLVKLRDRRARDEAGVFLIEGYREIRRALEKGVALRELYFSPDWFLGENEPDLIAQAQKAGAGLFEVTREAFAKAAYRERPDGLIALAPQWKTTWQDLDKVKPALPWTGTAKLLDQPGHLSRGEADVLGLKVLQ